jgi:hypothetical protein
MYTSLDLDLGCFCFDGEFALDRVMASMGEAGTTIDGITDKI